ncbi:unnamed protein product [Miscanthus lutarioriparius]|uniref:MYB-CC type transcription factor LHEQLE-containing domain-containing protein n=1 Tax=Miscanthus lutarioriparius TaxID=422564 RepID=A0A811NNF9_9POAL|nr:unnamed protein product [Miscanthus lutarioriparius]
MVQQRLRQQRLRQQQRQRLRPRHRRWETSRHREEERPGERWGGRRRKQKQKTVDCFYGFECFEIFHVASYLLDAQSGMSVSPRVPAQEMKESQEVKEALRAQMEVQRRLHEQVEVQKRVQIRMEALQKYIDSILASACKIVTEQFASSGFSISDPDLPEISPGGFMCGPTDTLSSSVFNQLSVSSIDSHSPGGKPSPSGMECPPLLLQKSPELKRRSS